MELQSKGVTIRNPSTANLLIDSLDRTYGTSADFRINKNYSILNGFFNRLGVAEVVLNWGVNNVSAATENTGLSVTVGATTYIVELEDGAYTIASCLDTLVQALNTEATGVTFSLVAGAGIKVLHGTGAFTINATNLASQLNLKTSISGTDFPVSNPVLLPYTYVDFVSSELTYNQSLKDAATNFFDQNVLYRWNFGWDVPSPVDTYGYPILQGYQRFVARRALPFPKQIRWESNMPVGQISFKVYSSQGTLLLPSQTQNGELEWSMTLLVSEN
jgi:hypothetical protein